MGIKVRQLSASAAPHSACAQATLILQYTHNSAGALLKAFELVRANRAGTKATVGMTTDDEQDILRAMLVMAGAGLDSMTKQLIRDVMPLLLPEHDLAREGLEKFLARQLSGDPESGNALRGSRFLATLLAAPILPTQVATEYVRHLTSGSLQSAEELIRIASAFGLRQNELKTNFQGLKAIFDVRNKIIHELDIDLGGERRKRNLRSKNQLVADANALLAAADDILRAVERQLHVLGV